ncbi:CidA/LrgA family holin-like protein [Paenibacillus xerothermodurans]|uniref:CidA/LrgA family holin-like protein n=1 Tax=Paenibacillus xerothermodurans TaxID=1977292 RepID=A0A2W1NYW8_PAEXE|nr:CidA/LrgA family holin-like protein [Paenibacillus xerothermodurans]PZE20732.1 CidA/LrgA family holin-like protein [Paenibacillus xerothermodurans]
MKTWVITTVQIISFIIVSKLMNFLADYFHLPIPGSILGIIVVFALLQAKIIRLSWVDFGAKWLIAEMLLFFIPSAVGVVQYKSLMLSSGPRILLVIAASSIIVMVCAGLIAQRLAKSKEMSAG